MNEIHGNAPDGRLLKPGEVALLAGVSHITIHRLVEAGRLPVACVTPGGHRRYRESDVLALLPLRAGGVNLPQVGETTFRLSAWGMAGVIAAEPGSGAFLRVVGRDRQTFVDFGDGLAEWVSIADLCRTRSAA